MVGTHKVDERVYVLAQTADVEGAIYFNGGEYSANDEAWVWITGESTNFSPWNRAPHAQSSCGSMRGGGGPGYVSASDCAGSLGAICEFGAY
jgi:hypothetical protein